MKVIEITNKDTAPGTSKPAVWLDANIHAGEITGRLYMTYLIERLIFEYGKNPDVTRLLDTRTFCVLPVFNADGGERILTRHPAWPGHNPKEHLGKDLDGDGYITQIRVKDKSREGGYRYYLESDDVVRGRGQTEFMNRRFRNELTGELHLPIPTVILGGPLYRGESFFMLFLFLGTVLLIGSGWCSHLCYIGAWDNLFASSKKNHPLFPDGDMVFVSEFLCLSYRQQLVCVF